MYRNIISLSLLTVSFYAAGAAQETSKVPSLKELALQRVVQTMTSQESARNLVRDPQKFEKYVGSYGVNSGMIKNIIVDQLLKPYGVDQYVYKYLSFDWPNRNDYAIGSVDWQPSGGLLALGTQYGRCHNSCPIFIYDPIRHRGNILRGHRAEVNAIAWHPGGELLASGSKDATVRVWNKNKDQAVKKLQGHQAEVNAIAWHPGGELLASGSDDRTVCIWDRRTGEIVKQLQHLDRVTSVSWHPDGELLASGSRDRTVRIWDRRTGEIVKQLQHLDRVTSVSWHPGGGLLASGSHDRTVRIWDRTTGEEIKNLATDSRVHSVAWNSDGRLLASGEEHGGICIWDVQGKIKERYDKYGYTEKGSVIWTPEGKLLEFKRGGGVGIWDVGAHERLIDSLSLMQALYFTHNMKHGDVIQAEIKCIEDVARQKRKQDYYSRGIFFDLDQIGYEGYINVRDIFFDFEKVEEILPTLKRKRAESSSSSSSSSSQKEELPASLAYMHDLKDSLPGALKHILMLNKKS